MKILIPLETVLGLVRLHVERTIQVEGKPIVGGLAKVAKNGDDEVVGIEVEVS